MKTVDVFVGSVRVRHGDNVTQFTVLVLESPAVSPIPLLEVYATAEKDANQSLNSLLLRRSFPEDVVATNVISRINSLTMVRKKDKNGGKKFKY
jgi:hypothetical protein